MRKSILLSALIAVMTPYLPLWRFDNKAQPILAGIFTFMIVFVNLYPDEVRKHD